MENHNILDTQNAEVDLKEAHNAMSQISAWSSAAAVFLSLFILGAFIIEIVLIQELNRFSSMNRSRIPTELRIMTITGGIFVICSVVTLVFLWRSTGGLKKYTYARDENVLEKALDKQNQWWGSSSLMLSLCFLGLAFMLGLATYFINERYQFLKEMEARDARWEESRRTEPEVIDRIPAENTTTISLDELEPINEDEFIEVEENDNN